jgi:hypothetical protein
MANQIQHKRSTTVRQPPALAFGELGYTTNGSILWIGQDAGDTANVIAIGGARVPGVLTANQSIVVDGNLFIDTLKVGNSTVNAVINSTSVKVMNSTSNGLFSIPTAADWAGNKFLHANGTWQTPVAAAAPAGSNTHVQFNDSGSLGGVAGLTFNQVSNNLTVSNTVLVGANVAISTTSLTLGLLAGTGLETIRVGNTTGNSTINSSSVAVGANVALNTTALTLGALTGTGLETVRVGNTTVNTTTNSTSISVGANSRLSSTALTLGALAGTGLETIRVGNTTGNTTINSTSTSTLSVIAGSNVVLNTTSLTLGLLAGTGLETIRVGNTTGNSTINSSSYSSGANVLVRTTGIAVGHLTGTGLETIRVGNTTVNTTTNSTSTAVGANVVLGSTALTLGALAGTGLETIRVGNTTTNTTINSTSIAVAGISGTTLTVSSNAVFNANVVTNGAVTNVNSTNMFINGTGLTVGANATFNANVTIQGDLIVNGTLATINVDTITVEDSIIKLASNNLTTNTIDIGLYGVYGNSTVTRFSGLFRDTSNAGIWTVFQDLEPEPGTTVDTANLTFTLGTLLSNFTTGSAFSANSTVVTIAAGSLAADLGVSDGGTGRGTITTNGIMYGNTTGPVGITAAGTEGQVFQAGASGVPLFAMLDGGTF